MESTALLYFSIPMARTRRKLPNYLRTHRKRVGFTQSEISFLLGSKAPIKVSRYERNVNRPALEVALAYEALFGTPVSEMFAGIYQEVERDILKRALRLASQLQKAPQNKATARKLEHLRILLVAPQIIDENS